MDKAKINSKIEYALQGISISKDQKAALIQLFTDIIQLAIEGSLEPKLVQATSDNLGCIKIGYSNNGKNYAVLLDSNGKAYVNVPWTDNDTIYSAATTTSLGLVKQADSVTDIDTSAQLTDVITAINDLYSKLRTCGIIKT